METIVRPNCINNSYYSKRDIVCFFFICDFFNNFCMRGLKLDMFVARFNIC